MYGAKLTLGLLRGKFEEFRLKESDADLREISTDERVKGLEITLPSTSFG